MVGLVDSVPEEFWWNFLRRYRVNKNNPNAPKITAGTVMDVAITPAVVLALDVDLDDVFLLVAVVDVSSSLFVFRLNGVDFGLEAVDDLEASVKIDEEEQQSNVGLLWQNLLNSGTDLNPYFIEFSGATKIKLS